MLAAARAEIAVAERQISEILTREPASFESPQAQRVAFNEARALKLLAAQRLERLGAREH